MADWLQLRVQVPVGQTARVTDGLLRLGATGLQEDHPGLHPDDGPLVAEGWTLPEASNPSEFVELTAWFPASEDADVLRNWLYSHFSVTADVREIANEDWNQSWKRSWQPGPLCARVLVVPSWLESPALSDDQVPFVMDPGLAFGTGTHPTTRGCAAFLDEHLREHPDARILDVGTGTGVLAIAALLLGAPEAVGVDTDPVAVDDARANAELNGVADRLTLAVGGVDAAPAGTYDFVAANLLAGILVGLAPSLLPRVAPGGRLVASGILCRQAAAVISAFEEAGGRLVARSDSPEWSTLLLEAT